MKSAEEIAKFKSKIIMTLVNLPAEYHRENGISESTYLAVEQEIAKALTEFAEERTKELKNELQECDKYAKEQYKAYDEGLLMISRDEALEEAAAIVMENYWHSRNSDTEAEIVLSNMILALKSGARKGVG